MTLNWSPRWSCLVPVDSSRPRISHQRFPCLVSDDAATALSWLSTTVILGHREIIATSSWLLKATILGPEWRGNDLDLTFNDCHAWSPLSYHDLELAINNCHAWSWVTRPRPWIGFHRQLCLVPEIMATMNRLSVIVMLSPTLVIGLWPWFSCQRLLYLVIKWLVASGPEACQRKSLSMTYKEFALFRASTSFTGLWEG